MRVKLQYTSSHAVPHVMIILASSLHPLAYQHVAYVHRSLIHYFTVLRNNYRQGFSTLCRVYIHFGGMGGCAI